MNRTIFLITALLILIIGISAVSAEDVNQIDDNIKVTISEDGEYTINGNNHVIDADNQAGVFKFINGKVIINNLKIANAKMSSIVLYNCALYTNNVTFENDYDSSE